MLHLLDPREDSPFPPVDSALREPNGLLAVGGNLSPTRLARAYREGIFPWYSQGQPVLWWSPDPRAVLYPEQLQVSRSLRKTLRKGIFRVSFDRAFPQVIRSCAAPRSYEDETWITKEMVAAYERLHGLGLAHSVEVWSGAGLAGGLYGVAVGRIFCGESMFSRHTDASKVALVALCRWLAAHRFVLVDCQVPSAHLSRLGAIEMPRSEYMAILRCWRDVAGPVGPWTDASIEAESSVGSQAGSVPTRDLDRA
jgi:leucyl/phenylalanyl-tRNA--protein transferase